MAERIALTKAHLINEADAAVEVAKNLRLFMDHWIVLDRLLLVNDDYINRVRAGEITANAYIMNGQVINQHQADSLSPMIADFHRKMEDEARDGWEEQFAKSQNWLRITSLAQAYLIWEEQIRGRLLPLIDFEHSDIVIEQSKAVIQGAAFGDLRKIRNSLWHAPAGSDELGICKFDVDKLEEINRFVNFEKDKPMVVAASELPEIGHHLFGKLQCFPEGYYLAEKH